MTLGDVPENLREIKIMTAYSVLLSGFCFRDLPIRVNKSGQKLCIKIMEKIVGISRFSLIKNVDKNCGYSRP